jgi:hypothetical protein
MFVQQAGHGVDGFWGKSVSIVRVDAAAASFKPSGRVVFYITSTA